MNNFFQHPHALVESHNIGENTRVWAFVHILSGAVIGTDCNICDHVFIENDVIVGNRVTVKCGVQLWDGIRVEDDVFIGPNATFTNDLFPRSRQQPDKFTPIHVQKGASIGANATILAGCIIGEGAMVGAGSMVTRNVPPYAIVLGNPAKITGYVSALSKEKEKIEADFNGPCSKYENQAVIPGVSFIKMPKVTDMRGDLTFGQCGSHIPFKPKRYFLVSNVPSREVRGEHAHKNLHQLLICVAGSCSVMLDDGKNRIELLLDRPDHALHISPLIWGVQYKYSHDAVLLVLASDLYDNDDYIRDYNLFVEMVKKR